MEPGFKFAKGEKIFCYYQGTLYEAKVLKCLLTDNDQRKYFAHYLGWSKKWDEWAVESRLKKYTLTNVELGDEQASDIGTIVNKTQAVNEVGSHSDSSHLTDIVEIVSSDDDGEEDSLKDGIIATARCSGDDNIIEIVSSDSDGEEETLEDEASKRVVAV